MKKWNASGISLNYVAVPLHPSCTFYRIEIFSKINSNLIKHRKRASHVYHFFSNQLPSFAQHWLQLNLNLPKQIPGYFDPAAQVKPNPTHVNPSRSYISMQQINAIILIICYYVTIALGLPTFNPNAQTTSRKNPGLNYLLWSHIDLKISSCKPSGGDVSTWGVLFSSLKWHFMG